MKRFIRSFLSRGYNLFLTKKRYIISQLEYIIIYKSKKTLSLPNNFLISNFEYSSNAPIDRVVYCFWTGENILTPNRIKSLKYIKQNVGVEVKLITNDNLKNYILKETPLHSAYPYLSNVHKADYLRTYFMHHYGGGYADIKRHDNNWLEAFIQLETNPNFWIIGYPETCENDIAALHGGFGIALKKHYAYLIGNGSYICKPYTPFTYSWINNLHKKLDEKELLLRKNPGGVWGNEIGYPLMWSEILGQIFHPLCYYFNEHVTYSQQLKYIKGEYR